MARKKAQKRANNDSLAKALIFFGSLLFIFGTFSHFQIIANSKHVLDERPSFNIDNQNPRFLDIPALGLSIGVSEGGILNGSWILSDFEALYLPTSGKVGEGYNTIIYAHNRRGLFENLDNLVKDETISVRDHEGREFLYRIYEIKEVDPKNIESLYSEEKNVLTLFTCSGWMDEKRLLVRAALIPLSATQE